MKSIKNIIIAGLIPAMLLSCSKFDDINTNPDSSTKVNSSLLATGAIAGIVESSTSKSFVSHMFITKYLGWGEGSVEEQYNDFGRASFFVRPMQKQIPPKTWTFSAGFFS